MAFRLSSSQSVRIYAFMNCHVKYSVSLFTVNDRNQHWISSRRFSRSVQHAIRSNMCDYLREGYPQKEQGHMFPQPRTLEVKDDYYLKHEANGLNIQGTLRILLLLHATQNDSESVLRLIKTAKAVGVKPSCETMASIVVAYIKNKNVDAALNMYSCILVEHPSVTLDYGMVINLCTLLVESGRNHEAIKTLKEHLELNVKKTDDIKKIRENCRDLLGAAATTCDYELTKQLFDVLLCGELVEPENFILVPLLQCKLNSDDLPGAVSVAETIYKTYNLLPKRMEILIFILCHYKDMKKKIPVPDFIGGMEQSNADTNILEHMLNLITQCYGSIQAQHDLVFAYLETGLPDDARQVLQNLGKEVNVNQLNKMCKVYLKMEREDALLHFLNASRGNDFIDHEKIFSALLDMYNAQCAGDKALSLWTLMQKEGFTPSEAFLSTLASLLAYNKIPFPDH